MNSPWIKKFLLIGGLLSWTPQALADWSMNLGYNNPPGATVGINFMNLWTNVAFECGIGWIDADAVDTDEDKTAETEEDKDTVKVAVAGDVNLKYLFWSGSARPYVQGGFGSGLSAAVGKSSGANAGLGGGFIGGGIFLGSPKIYGYGSINSGGHGNFFQAGLGFDI